jgi:hypothetical protein
MTVMTGHYQGIVGANTIATEQLLDTADLVKDIVEVRAMGAIYGPAGVGKTFAVDQALADQPEGRWTRSTFRSRPTTRYLRHELYTDLGLGPAVPNSPVETDRILRAALAERVRLLVIDEAQWLNREVLEYLRYLHDDPRREPMLSSRLYEHLRFSPLKHAEVLKVIPVYHAIYAGVPAALISRVNAEFARGNFREWAKFTDHARRFIGRTDRQVLDEEVARNVLSRVNRDGDLHAAQA